MILELSSSPWTPSSWRKKAQKAVKKVKTWPVSFLYSKCAQRESERFFFIIIFKSTQKLQWSFLGVSVHISMLPAWLRHMEFPWARSLQQGLMNTGFSAASNLYLLKTSLIFNLVKIMGKQTSSIVSSRRGFRSVLTLQLLHFEGK